MSNALLAAHRAWAYGFVTGPSYDFEGRLLRIDKLLLTVEWTITGAEHPGGPVRGRRSKSHRRVSREASTFPELRCQTEHTHDVHAPQIPRNHRSACRGDWTRPPCGSSRTVLGRPSVGRAGR